MELERLVKEWIFSTKEFLILVSSSQTVLQNTTSSTSIFSLQPVEYKLVLQCMVHNLSGFQSKVYRVPVSIRGLQSSCIDPRFTEFLSLSRIFRVPISIQSLQISSIYAGFTEFPSLQFLQFAIFSLSPCISKYFQKRRAESS